MIALFITYLKPRFNYTIWPTRRCPWRPARPCVPRAIQLLDFNRKDVPLVPRAIQLLDFNRRDVSLVAR
jgi:hypothetical protein